MKKRIGDWDRRIFGSCSFAVKPEMDAEPHDAEDGDYGRNEPRMVKETVVVGGADAKPLSDFRASFRKTTGC